MRKYDKIRYVDMYPDLRAKRVQVTVKYDGSNGRLGFTNDHFIFGTRSTENTNVDYLPHGLGECYKPLAGNVWSLPQAERDELAELLKNNVLFFEVCGLKNKLKLRYEWDLDYIAFDLWIESEGKYVGFDDPRFTRVIEILHMKKAEILPFDFYDDAWKWLQEQDGTKIEGVVVKDYASGMRCKALHPKNAEIESSVFTKKRGTPDYWESRFLHTYLTWKRVEKMYQAAVLEDGAPGMSCMPFALKRLYQDLIVECLPAFIMKEKPDGINIKYIKKHMPDIARPMIMRMVAGLKIEEEQDNDMQFLDDRPAEE